MTVAFYIAAVVAVLATIMVITRRHPVHALLYFVVSLLSVAVIFFLLGAPFVAALEVIIYAGAIMVLFVFVVMLLDVARQPQRGQRELLALRSWVGPAALALILAIELGYLLAPTGALLTSRTVVEPSRVGATLFGPYLLAVELASMLLLAGLVAAYHLGRRPPQGGRP